MDERGLLMTKTEQHQLNQWDPEDKVQREDLCEDNRKIDAALAVLVAGPIDSTCGGFLWIRSTGSGHTFLNSLNISCAELTWEDRTARRIGNYSNATPLHQLNKSGRTYYQGNLLRFFVPL